MMSGDSGGRPPRLSAVLLSYNHRATIVRAVESVFGQTFGDFELIVSDDCSTDGSPEVLDALSRRDSRMRVVRAPTNLGMARHANFAVSLSRAPVVALLHHDDELSPELFEEWMAIMDAHPSVMFAFNRYVSMPDGQVFSESIDRVIGGQDLLLGRLLAQWGSPVRGAACIRRSAWDDEAGMDPGFGMLADVDLWMRLCRRGDVGYAPTAHMKVYHEPVDDYPVEYSTVGGWHRLHLLHRIHWANTNRLAVGERRAGGLGRTRLLVRAMAEMVHYAAYRIWRFGRTPLGAARRRRQTGESRGR